MLSFITVFSMLSFCSCAKTPVGKSGFFDSQSSLSPLLSSVTFGIYCDDTTELLEKDTVKNSYTATVSGAELESDLTLTLSSLSSSAKKQSTGNMNISYLNENVDISFIGNNGNTYIQSAPLFKKYVSLNGAVAQTDNEYLKLLFANSDSLSAELLDKLKEITYESQFSGSKNSVTVDGKERELDVITLSLNSEQTKEYLNSVAENESIFKILNALSVSEKNLPMKYSRGIYKNTVYYEDITIGEENEFKLFYIFADGKKDSATLDVTLDGEKLIEAEYTLEGAKDAPTKRINIKLPDTEIKLVFSASTVKRRRIVADVTLDIITDGVFTVSGTFTGEARSKTEFSVAFDGKCQTDGTSYSLKIDGITDIGSAEEPNAEQLTSEQIYAVNSSSDLAGIAMDIAVNASSSCPALFDLITK